MKKMLLVCSLFVAAFAANAQDDANPNVVKVNPLGLLFGSANIGYERAFGQNSVLIAPQFGGFKLGGVKYQNTGIGAQYRRYFSKTKVSPEGMYIAPGVNYTSGKVTFDDGSGTKEEIKFSSMGAGAMVGHQWIYPSGFVLDLGAGINYQKFNYKGDEEFAILKASGMLPAISFSIGYNF